MFREVWKGIQDHRADGVTKIAKNIINPVLVIYSRLCSSMCKKVEILEEERVNAASRHVILTDLQWE